MSVTKSASKDYQNASFVLSSVGQRAMLSATLTQKARSPAMGVRTEGQIGSADPPGKMDEKLISENMQKEQFSMFMLYFESNRGRQV